LEKSYFDESERNTDAAFGSADAVLVGNRDILDRAEHSSHRPHIADMRLDASSLASRNKVRVVRTQDEKSASPPIDRGPCELQRQSNKTSARPDLDRAWIAALPDR
jgi:hypothetical protein